MADNFVQSVHATGTTTISITLNSVVAGNVIAALLGDGANSAPATFTVADGQGSYTNIGTNLTDAPDAVICGQFRLLSANSGTHNITGTLPSGDVGDMWATEVGTTAGGSAISGQIQQKQASPGGGTDAISSSTCPISAAATLLAITVESSDAVLGDVPNVGTGFSSRSSGVSGACGDWRLETIAASADKAATWTSGSAQGNTQTYLSFAVGILNAAAGGGAASRINFPNGYGATSDGMFLNDRLH